MVDVIYRNSPTEDKIIELPSKENFDELSQNFIKWLKTAKRGEKFQYYLGDYVAGKLVGRLAQDAYMYGQVILYQKKEGKKYGYWAQRRG